ERVNVFLSSALFLDAEESRLSVAAVVWLDFNVKSPLFGPLSSQNPDLFGSKKWVCIHFGVKKREERENRVQRFQFLAANAGKEKYKTGENAIETEN
ncbi:unnamed protein product, partial [Oikopleura dioica]